MNTLCECLAAGFCPRHQMEKDQRLFECCQGISGDIRCGNREWRSWEQGYLGATSPSDPQPDIDWPCSQVVLRKPRNSPLVRPRRNSGQHTNPDIFSDAKCEVGKRVKYLVKTKYKVAPRANCKCEAIARRMDTLGCDGCEREIDSLSQALLESAAERWWIRPLVHLFEDNSYAAARDIISEAIADERTRLGVA